MTAFITITTMIVGWLTLWVKLRYSVQKSEEATVNAQRVESKIDVNNAMTSRIEFRTNGPIDKALEQQIKHTGRIEVVEDEVRLIKVSLDSLSKDLASTRHELRGHLQTIANGMQLLAVKGNKENSQ